MPYDPFKHHRRSIRLKGYDYSQAGAYFVTLVAEHRECLFGEIVDGAMVLNRLGKITAAQWQSIPRYFPTVALAEWVVMPNHLHGILILDNVTPMIQVPPPAFRSAPANSLGAIIGNFKSVTTRRINTMRQTTGAPVWQRNYYEHIIRNDRDYARIATYICDNPANWSTDDEHP